MTKGTLLDDLRLYGPPGCGKTTAGIAWLAARVEAGADLRRVSFVSFTNAAVNVAKERLTARFGIDPRELTYCATLHALCKRSLGIRQQDWRAEDHLEEFAAAKGYDLKVPGRRRGGADDEDLEEKTLRSGRDAPLLEVWDFGRQRLLFTPAGAWKAFALYNPAEAIYVPYERFEALIRDYERWKSREALRDMTDLLREFLEHPVALPVSVAVIDEAQDCSALMWAVVDRMFAAAACRAVLGDDDQALYSFSGAVPELFNRRDCREIVKLRHSYRLAAPVVRAARRLIEQNVNREWKEIEPAGHAGEVGWVPRLDDLPLLNGKSWFLQVRNWRLFDQLAADLEAAGVPYVVRGGRRHSPWGSETRLLALRTVLRLRDRQPVTVADVRTLSRYGHSERPGKSAAGAAGAAPAPGIWSWGAKRRLEAAALTAGQDAVFWYDLGALGMTASGVAGLLGESPFAVLTRELAERDRSAYEVAHRKGTLLAAACVQVGSCHSFKGDEADYQATLGGCTGRPYRALQDGERIEEERRVLYTALTRAKYGSYGLPPQSEPGIYPWEIMNF